MAAGTRNAVSECVSLNCGRCKSVMEGAEQLKTHEKFSQILKSTKS